MGVVGRPHTSVNHSAPCPTTTRSSRASQMGNQSSTSAPPPPLSYSHSSPSSSSHSPTPSTEPSNSSECHACASTPDSPALSPLPSPLPTSPLSSSPSPPPCYAYSHSSCPLNRAELGRASWAYLHTLAAYYPTSPSPSQQSTMSQFLSSYAALYPCGYCADRTVEELTRNPPRVGSQGELSVWMCEVHNEVNERLNKPTFDCTRTHERWKTGDPAACGR